MSKRIDRILETVAKFGRLPQPHSEFCVDGQPVLFFQEKEQNSVNTCHQDVWTTRKTFSQYKMKRNRR